MANMHWNYFIALEDDLEKVARYIEFNEENYKTYSLELAHLLLAASSEVDVVLKELCRLIAPSSNPNHINDYRKIVLSSYSDLPNIAVYSRRHQINLYPWLSWQNEESPDWWRSYNKVKHDRGENFLLANLGNTLNSVGALNVVNIFYNYELQRQRHSEKGLENVPSLYESFCKLLPRNKSFFLHDIATAVEVNEQTILGY